MGLQMSKGSIAKQRGGRSSTTTTLSLIAHQLSTSTHLIIVKSRIPVRRRILSCVQRLHVLVRQFEIKHLRILLDAIGRDGFGKWDKALKPVNYHPVYILPPDKGRFDSARKKSKKGRTNLLQPPPNHNLCRRLAILLPQICQQRLLHPLTMRQRRICLDNDIPLLEPLNDPRPVTPRVYLVLPNIDLAPVAAGLDVRL